MVVKILTRSIGGAILMGTDYVECSIGDWGKVILVVVVVVVNAYLVVDKVQNVLRICYC